MRLSAKPPLIASRTLAGSAPPCWHSSSASATAPIVMPTIIWLASLASWPAPCGPTWVARPSGAKTGAARAKSAASPPAMMASVPCSAPTVPPETGASRWCRPMACSRQACSRACDGMMEDMSISKAPGAIAAAAPCSNSTSATTAPSVSSVITKSAPATASAGLSATRAPSAASRSALLRSRFQTLTRWPAWHRRRAIG